MDGLAGRRNGETPSPVISRRDSVLSATLWAAGVAVAVALYMLRAAEQTDDSLAYALLIRSGEHMFHPHHLLFIPAVRAVYRMLGPYHDAIEAAQVHNIAWAVAGVAAMSQLVGHLRGSRIAGLAGGLALCGAHGFWIYATQAEVYVPATACLAVALCLVTGPASRGTDLAISLFFALAVLYHQTNVLFAAPLAVAVILQSNRRAPLRMVALLVPAGMLVGAAYLLAYPSMEGGSGVRPLLHFVFRYAYRPEPDWGTFRHFSAYGLGALAVNQISDVAALPLPLHARGGTLCLTVLATLLLWNAFRLRSNRFRRLRAVNLVWLLVYYLFFLWWLPSEAEFFITPLVPLFLLATLMIGDVLEELAARPALRRLVAVVALLAPIVIATHTLVRRVLPLHRSRGGGFFEAEMLADAARDGCLIWTSRRAHGNLRYYFTQARVVDAAEPLIRLYHGEPAPEVDWTRAERCVVASVWHLDPRYSVGGYDGYARTAEWSRYFSAVAGLEVPGARGIRSRSLAPVRRPDVLAAYLRFTSDRLEFPNPREFRNALAAAAGGDFAAAVERALERSALWPKS